jgi:acetate kinase
MGMTPLEGAVMETRCGDIDPGIHAYIMQKLDLSPQELEQILNQKSGIAGLTGRRRSRQHYLQAADDGESRSKLALEIEAYRLKKYIGSYLAIIGPLDAIVFTSGSGPLGWLLRELVLSGLDCFGIRLDRDRNRTIRSEQRAMEITAEGSRVRLLIMPTDEERVIAEDVAAIHSGVCCDHKHYEYSFAVNGFVPEASQR